ncbi:MAG: hypothetical protein ABI399_07700, partial [Bauldia sp.]
EKTALDQAIDQDFTIEDKAAAIDVLGAALAEAEAAGEAPRLIAEGTFYLGRARYQSEDLPAAEETLRRAIKLIEDQGEAGDVALKIDVMDTLGKAVGRQGRLAGALQIFNRVLQLKATAKGRTDIGRIATMEAMAITLESAGQFPAAEFYWRTALGIGLDTRQKEEDIAFWRKALAANLEKQERNDDSARVRDGEKVADMEGALLAAITEGEALRKAKRNEEAHALYRKIANDFVASAGDSMLYMLVLKDLAETGDQEDHATVATTYEQAIAIEDRLLGLTPTVPGEFRYLAGSERAFAGDFGKADKWFASLNEPGSDWVNRDVAERQRVVEAILGAASGEKGALENCSRRADVRSREEILYAGYSIERALARVGGQSGRAPALRCSLTLAGGDAPAALLTATLIALGLAEVDGGQYGDAIATLAEARKAIAGSGWPDGQVRMLVQYQALAHGWIREFDEAFRLLDESETIGGPLTGWDKLTALRVRTVMLLNATRYPEAEEAVRQSLALLDDLAGGAVAFDNDGASALNDFATVLVRAGRSRDALKLIERIALPDSLPADASNHALLFFVDLRENRMRLHVSLGDIDAAREAAAEFRAAAIPAVDLLLADPERNRIVAATMAATINSGALAMVGLGLSAEAAEVAGKAAALIADDRSDGVRLLSARVDLVRGVAELSGGRPAEALPRFDRALAVGKTILPDTSDEMYEIWAGRGLARLGLTDPAALGDLRQATQIARARIAAEARFDDSGVQRTMRPSFEALVGAAWQAAGS